MPDYPRVLHVDTSYAPMPPEPSTIWAEALDYNAYQRPRLEQALRLDFELARRARDMAGRFDVLLAGSEKVGIPLAFMRLPCPLITVGHHMASPYKRWLVKMSGATRRWARIGGLSQADLDFMATYYGTPRTHLFRFITAPLQRFTPGDYRAEGPIVSVGVSKRDYGTLLDALRQLPGYQTEIHAASRFKDNLSGGMGDLPPGVCVVTDLPSAAMPERYRTARFVVLPMLNTSQFSAGASVALEAHASGCAVIATNTPGMRDYVVDGVTGLLVPPGDAAALRDAIQKLWENPSLAHQMGRSGRSHIEAEFDPEQVNQKVRHVLAEVYAEFKGQ